MPLPVEAEVPQASQSNPVLGLLLSLETPTMIEALVVAEAADRVGYGSPSQFSREFNRLYGMPPRQWATAAIPAGVPGR